MQVQSFLANWSEVRSWLRIFQTHATVTCVNTAPILDNKGQEDVRPAFVEDNEPDFGCECTPENPVDEVENEERPEQG